jgi:hypothetical protein
VIIILTTIVAAAIPIMTPADEDRRLREASRILNTFITSAQSRAIATNRLYGIGLKRLSQDTGRPEDRGVCLQVYYVEQQPPFCGFDENAAAMVAFDNGSGGAGVHQFRIRFVTRGLGESDGLPVGWDPDLLPAGTIRPGDIVDVAGTSFQLTDNSDLDPHGYYQPISGTPDGTLVAVPVNGTGQQLNPKYDNLGAEIATISNPPKPFYTAPARYKIFRQPVTTSDAPFQMPEGTAIDLRASGLGYSESRYFYWPGTRNDDARIHDNNDPVLVLFTPEGKVGRLRYNLFPYEPQNAPQIFDEPVVDNLFLLVGQRGKIPAPALDRDVTLTTNYPPEANKAGRERAREPINWLSGTSRWIMIGSQSGRVATVANTFVDPKAVYDFYTASPRALAASSEELRSEQIMAARALTRETRQETGR